MSPPPSVFYVYGVVASSSALRGSPEGLEDAPLQLVGDERIAALASELDGERYSPASIERDTENVDWLAPRAVAHDRVLTWASDRGPVVPLPMFSLFSSEETVRAMLRERGEELGAALRRAAQGREYTLRVYRVDTELNAVASELSPALAELARAAAAASPGQRYLLQRKLEGERKAEVRTIAQRIGRDILAALGRHSVGMKEETAARRESTGAVEQALVLDAAFLVPAANFDAFQAELTSLVGRHEGRGFRFDFTGPWPPYHFVKDVVEETTRES